MTEWNAPQLLETTGSYWQGCAIMAGVELNLFNELHHKADTPAGLAGRIKAEPRALAMLLRSLAALDLLEVNAAGEYHPSPAGSQLLVSDSNQYMGNIISHQHHLVESWSQLHQAVRTGRPMRQRSSFSEGAWRKSFLLGMQDLANFVAPQLVPHIDIGARRKMLDLGGGPGTWSIHFCRQNPQLRATIFDLPTSRDFAEYAIKEADMDDKISFTGGDFNQMPLPDQDFDLVWMSHILHGEGEVNCRELVAKAASALAPDGLLLIHEFILDDDKPGPVYPALFALNMLLGTEEGKTYTEGELRKYLAVAGLVQIKRLPVPPWSRSGILVASKL